MAGNRARPFSIILLLCFFLAGLIGFFFPYKQKRAMPLDSANLLRTKRWEAIKKAAQSGQNTYQFIFEVDKAEIKGGI